MQFRRLRNFFTSQPTGPNGQTYQRGFFRTSAWLGCWLIVIVAISAALAAAGIQAHQFVTYDKPKSQIEVVVKRDSGLCKDTQWPIFVGIVNNSSRTVLETRVHLAARLPSHSTDYADRQALESDRILKPTEGWGSCWNPPLRYTYRDDTNLKRDELEWTLSEFSVTFSDQQ